MPSVYIIQLNNNAAIEEKDTIIQIGNLNYLMSIFNELNK